MVRSKLELAEFADCTTHANRERGTAPSRQDVMTQYAIVKMFDLDDEPTLQLSLIHI